MPYSNFYTMHFKKIKQSTLLGIAVIITVLFNLPRVFQFYNIIGGLNNSSAVITIQDILVRATYLFLFCWIVLLFNANWKLFYQKIPLVKKIVAAVIVNGFLLFFAPLFFTFLYPKIVGHPLETLDENMLYFGYFIIFLILIFISRILRYQIQKEEDTAEKELLKQQSLENELAALKNQINPHFLFNSLNSLNSLVRENKEATTFVSKLSFMYRYILQSNHTDLIPLKEEIKFLESYVYLIKTRYRDNFEIQMDLNETIFHNDIPVLGLQLLVENAVKHNEISKNNPLLVKVYAEDNFLIVENKIKPRTSFVDSTGNGLANLDKRYFLLKKQHISIENTNETFKVKLPLNSNS